MLTIGQTLQRFRVEELVGQGGMATVYRVRHLQLESDHALKVLFVTSPAVRERLLIEGKVQANLRHPNIVSVTDVLDLKGVPALVMEYVEGPSLDDWLAEQHPTLEEALWLFRGILRGVGAAHSRGVVHRDLKPANVLLSPSSSGFVPKVTDFGLVKSLNVQESISHSGVALGTPEYMSPEQIRDASGVDQRADMWALGCILYELVCGCRPFTADDRRTIFERIVNGTRRPATDFVPSLPRAVSRTIDGLLALDPDRRMPDAESTMAMLYSSESPLPKGPRPATALPPILVSGSATSGFEADFQDPLQAAPTGTTAMRRTLGPSRPSECATTELRFPKQAAKRQWGWAAWLPFVTVVVVTLGGLLVAAMHNPPRVEGPEGLEPIPKALDDG